MQSGMTEEYVKRKHGKAKIEKIHPLFDIVTQETYGLIVYQEQVMKGVNVLSGIPMSTCNKIRKIIGKSMGNKAFDEYREEFVSGCVNCKTVTEKKASEIWDMMSKFGGYGFNKAHAVEYSMITYWDMWAKTYYPNEYLACCLSLGNKDKNVEYMREARALKLDIRLPKVGTSMADQWFADTNGNLYAPFTSISGVGINDAAKISETKLSEHKRKGFFNTAPTQRIKGVKKTTIDTLSKIHAFDADYETTKQDLKKYRRLFTF